MERGDGGDDDDDDVGFPSALIAPPADADAIVVLEWPDSVRLRPEIFVSAEGDGRGMHALLWACVGESVDEHLRGHARRLRIDFDGDAVIIEDDGRGLAVAPRWSGYAETALEFALTGVFYGGQEPDRHATRSHVTLHGYPIACALAAELDVTVWRDGEAHVQRFVRGLAAGPAQRVGPTTRTGLRVRFVPDFTVLPRDAWDRAAIERRCDELAALMPDLTITVEGHAHRHPDGLAGWLRAHGASFEPFRARCRRDTLELDVAIALGAPGPITVHSFRNYRAAAAGAQVAELEASVHAVLARRAPRLAALAPATFRSLLDRSGAMLAIHVADDFPERAPEPGGLVPEVRAAIGEVIGVELPAYFERVPAMLDALLLRLEQADARS